MGSSSRTPQFSGKLGFDHGPREGQGMSMLRRSGTVLTGVIVAALVTVFIMAGPAIAASADDPTFSVPQSLLEQFDNDNRARELAGQEARLARYDARRGERAAALSRLEQAIKLAAQIQGIRKRTVALVNIATVQAEVGDSQGALHTVSTIQSLTERDSTLRTMALYHAKAGDVETATVYANAIQDTSKKTDATRYIEALQSVKPLGF